MSLDGLDGFVLLGISSGGNIGLEIEGEFIQDLLHMLIVNGNNPAGNGIRDLYYAGQRGAAWAMKQSHCPCLNDSTVSEKDS
jgi:hypothetical protein